MWTLAECHAAEVSSNDVRSNPEVISWQPLLLSHHQENLNLFLSEGRPGVAAELEASFASRFACLKGYTHGSCRPNSSKTGCRVSRAALSGSCRSASASWAATEPSSFLPCTSSSKPTEPAASSERLSSESTSVAAFAAQTEGAQQIISAHSTTTLTKSICKLL